MTTDKLQIDAYFTQNYAGLLKYARKIINDRGRTYDAEDVVAGVYEVFVNKGVKNLDTIDHYCKRWIQLTIINGRSFANKDCSIQTGRTHRELWTTDGEIAEEENPDVYNEPDSRVVDAMSERERTWLSMYLCNPTFEDLGKTLKVSAEEAKTIMRAVRACYRKTSKQIVY